MHAPRSAPTPYDQDARFALVIDDIPMVRKAVTSVLVRAGYLVIPAKDGVEAVETAPLFPFSLIVTDLEMPGMSGLDTVRHIRRLGGCLADVPIVLLSRAPEPPDRESLRTLGIDAFIPDGNDAATLLAAIEALTRRRNATTPRLPESFHEH